MGLSGGAIAGICIGGFVVLYIIVALVAIRVFPVANRDAVRARLRRRFPFSLRHISHRGASMNGPENTLFAFQRALAEGRTTMLEMDVNESADGVPIVSHDLTLERICDAPHSTLSVSDLRVFPHRIADEAEAEGKQTHGKPNKVTVETPMPSREELNAALPQLRRRIPLHFASRVKGKYFNADDGSHSAHYTPHSDDEDDGDEHDGVGHAGSGNYSKGKNGEAGVLINADNNRGSNSSPIAATTVMRLSPRGATANAAEQPRSPRPLSNGSGAVAMPHSRSLSPNNNTHANTTAHIRSHHFTAAVPVPMSRGGSNVSDFTRQRSGNFSAATAGGGGGGANANVAEEGGEANAGGAFVSIASPTNRADGGGEGQQQKVSQSQRQQRQSRRSQPLVVPRDHTTRLLPLTEVFDAFPSTPIHLDIKSKSDAMTHLVIDLIEAYGRENITVVGSMSSNVDAIRAARKLPQSATRGLKAQQQQHVASAVEKPPRPHSDHDGDGDDVGAGQLQVQQQQHQQSGWPYPSEAAGGPAAKPLVPKKPSPPSGVVGPDGRKRKDTIRTFASFGQVIKVYLLFYIGLLPFVPIEFDLFSIPGPTRAKQQLFGLRPVVARFLLGFLRAPTLWRHLQRRGVGVVVWVLNDADEFEEAAKWPVNGIMTDDAIALRRFYESKNSKDLEAMLLWD